MCQKCNYKVRETLKAMISDNPADCFFQKGLNSTNPRVQILTRSAMRAVFSGMSIEEFVNRIYQAFKDLEVNSEKREAYQQFLKTIPFFEDIDEESKIYKEEVYGGLID